ncbi:MAG TPA: CRISPR-associated endonuclease Cas2 [Bacillota bacterium]|nr:CRISPR-associated endonuclease Cas2 [Bacillota bacterium]
MLTWVIYDIECNRIRTRVAKVCKNAGLYRVQKSVFLGTLEDNEFDELKLRIEGLVDLEKDSVYVFPMNKSELRVCGLIGQAFDKELVTDAIISKFF